MGFLREGSSIKLDTVDKYRHQSLDHVDGLQWTERIVKITFVIPHDSLAGGVRVVAIYAQRLQARGHHVTVVSAPRPRASLKKQLKTLIQEPWSLLSPSRESYFDAIAVPHHRLNQYRPLRDEDLPDADLLIATWWETAEWIAPLSLKKGVKVYFIQHHEVFDYLPQDRVAATYRLPLFHITISQWLLEILRDRYQSPDIALVPNGVDLQQFCSPPRSKQTIPTVGLIYSTTPWKGTDIALNAVRQAQQHRPHLRLLAFSIERPSASLPLPPATQFCFQPSQESLKHLYAQCDAWLFSSRVEGFGLPILEAMACRTPVIATPAGAAPELLTEGGGILLESCHPAPMATALQSLLALDATQWQALSEQAFHTATRHSWEQATLQFESALHHALVRASVHC